MFEIEYLKSICNDVANLDVKKTYGSFFFLFVSVRKILVELF